MPKVGLLLLGGATLVGVVTLDKYYGGWWSAPKWLILLAALVASVMLGYRVADPPDTPKLAGIVAKLGRMLVTSIAVLCTIEAFYIAVWAWRIPLGDMESREFSTAFAFSLGVLGLTHSTMATAARTLPWWWLGYPTLACATAWVRWEFIEVP